MDLFDFRPDWIQINFLQIFFQQRRAFLLLAVHKALQVLANGPHPSFEGSPVTCRFFARPELDPVHWIQCTGSSALDPVHWIQCSVSSAVHPVQCIHPLQCIHCSSSTAVHPVQCIHYSSPSAAVPAAAAEGRRPKTTDSLTKWGPVRDFWDPSEEIWSKTWFRDRFRRRNWSNQISFL